MYLRTAQRRKADGSIVRYYQLAENVWDSNKRCSIARVVYSFGRADQVDVEVLRRLAASVVRVTNDEAPERAGVVDGAVKVCRSWSHGATWVLGQLWSELGLMCLGSAVSLQIRADVARVFRMLDECLPVELCPRRIPC